MYRRFFKRAIDIIFSLLGIIVLSPFFLLLFIIIKIDSRGSIFFKQKRIGRYKTHFLMYKFRTMKIDTPQDIPTHLFEKPEKYITRVGKFLRMSSLDEVPQLWNILVAHMSIIGPRPALWNQYDLIQERDKFGANDVRPGLTGWAQVNGRDELPITVKAALDGEYVKKISLFFDIKCLFMTVSSVIHSKGIVEGSREHRKKDSN